MISAETEELIREYSIKEIKVMIYPLLVGVINSLVGKYNILFALITIFVLILLNILRIKWKKTNLTFDYALYDGSVHISFSIFLLLTGIRILRYCNCSIFYIILSLFIYILWNYLLCRYALKEKKSDNPLLSALGSVSFSGLGTVMLIKLLFRNTPADKAVLLIGVCFLGGALVVCWGYAEIAIQVKKKKQREKLK